METGTGKTYCYIKTIFELNKQYGWSKFIIVVPSIAIREGVAKSLEITAEHFLETYHKKARFFIYNSKQLAPPGKLLVRCGYQRHGDQRAGVRRQGR
jgi:type III restriction enzyme